MPSFNFGPELHWDAVSRPLNDPALIVLNLGVGLQSSTMLEMADRGELGRKPDVAMFSDLRAERKVVYEFLAYLRDRVSIPIVEVSQGDLGERVMAGGSSSIPAFVEGAPINRGCTRDYKVTPIEREIRRMMGWTGRPASKVPVVEQWFGITTDEIQRVKPSRNTWSHNRHPLIEARMSRPDCTRYREERQLRAAPWSACVFCPFQGPDEWREVRQDPDAWAKAVAVDRSLRDPAIRRTPTKAPMYLHRSCRPLDEVDFDAVEVRPQLGFGHDCEGMCGV